MEPVQVGPGWQIFALTLDGRGEVANFDPMGPKPADLHWIHISSDDPAFVANLLRTQFAIHPHEAEEAAFGRIQSTITQRSGRCYAVVPVPHFLKGQPTGYDGLAFFAGDGGMLTVSNRRCCVVNSVLNHFRAEPGDFGTSAASALEVLLSAVIDSYYPIVDSHHDDMEDLEEQVYDGKIQSPGRAVALKRQLLEMRRRLSAFRDVVNSLLRHGPPLITPELMTEFVDIQASILRAMDNIDVGRDILSAVLDAQLGMQSNRLNEIMRTMTVISTLMMACTLVSGIYGMNFKHMPELQWQFGYPFAIFLMACACGGVIWYFRRRDWL